MTPALPGAKVVCWTPIGWEWSMAFFPIGCWKIDKHSDYMIRKFLIVHVIMTINRFLSKPNPPPQPLHLDKLTDLNHTFTKGIYSGIMRSDQKWICLNFMAPDLTVTKIFKSLNLVLTQIFKRKVHKFRVNSQTWGWVLTWGEFVTPGPVRRVGVSDRAMNATLRTCEIVPCREVSSAGIGRAQASSMLGNFFCL